MAEIPLSVDKSKAVDPILEVAEGLQQIQQSSDDANAAMKSGFDESSKSIENTNKQ